MRTICLTPVFVNNILEKSLRYWKVMFMSVDDRGAEWYNDIVMHKRLNYG